MPNSPVQSIPVGRVYIFLFFSPVGVSNCQLFSCSAWQQ